MGHLSSRLAAILAERQISERQAAARSDMRFESFRKILRGITARPRDDTLRKIADGLGVPMEWLVEERARDANEPFANVFVVEDITAGEAVEIAIARVNELSPDEAESLRGQLEELLRAMQQESSESQRD